MGTKAEVATVRVPDDAAGRAIHGILTATDSGHPGSMRYRRVVVTVSKVTQSQELPRHRP
jgi:hypothetical protein